jgi:hypothetical protein
MHRVETSVHRTNHTITVIAHSTDPPGDGASLQRSSLQVVQMCCPGKTDPVLLKSLKMSSQVAP